MLTPVLCVTGGVTYPFAAGVAGVGAKPPKPGSVNSWCDCLLAFYYSVKSAEYSFVGFGSAFESANSSLCLGGV